MTEEKTKKRLNIMLDEDKYEEFTEYARNNYTDKSKLIRKYIDQALQSTEDDKEE